MSDAGVKTRARFLLDAVRSSVLSGSQHFFSQATSHHSQSSQIQITHDSTQNAEIDAQDSFTPPASSVSNQDKLDLIENIIDEQLASYAHQSESSQVVAQAIPALETQLTQQEQAVWNTHASSAGKVEGRAGSTLAIDMTTIDDGGGGVQFIEQERTPEVPPEVEEYLQRVEDHAETLPHEIVIADGHTQPTTSHTPTQPVIVLPITQEQEAKARFKSASFSIKWLVTWSKKIIDVFKGRVIYRIVGKQN